MDAMAKADQTVCMSVLAPRPVFVTSGKAGSGPASGKWGKQAPGMEYVSIQNRCYNNHDVVIHFPKDFRQCLSTIFNC